MSRVKSGVYELTFLLYPCGESLGKYVAHCLELDVVSVAPTKPKAIELLKELIGDLFAAAHEDGTFDKVFNPAPRKYWEMLGRVRA